LKKESLGKILSKKEKATLIDGIIKKAQNNKINDDGNQLTREEFELIPWECYPGKDFGMPKVISNLIKILTGINL